MAVLGEESEARLIAKASGGDRAALELIAARYQNWIYNIALRMVGSVADAEDVTQEILIKIITRLDSFKGNSSFKTWLYRIVKNHVFSMQRRGLESAFTSFEVHSEIVEAAPYSSAEDEWSEQERGEMVEETKIKCMMGLLTCLSREQRLVFILGGIFGADSTVGAEIMETSADNFRQKLSRARRDISRYMNGECSLLNAGNSCRCQRKAKAAVSAGFVDPKRRIFHAEHLQRVRDVVDKNVARVDDALELRMLNLFSMQPFVPAPDYSSLFQELLEGEGFHDLVEFG